MRIAERDAFHLALKAYAGDILNSNVMVGGNLCAHPSSMKQQEFLLNATCIADKEISCSLPPSSSIFKGLIFGVPIADKEEEILAALSDQNVIHVKRLPIKGHPEIHSETILLTFTIQLPERVKIKQWPSKSTPPPPPPSAAKSVGSSATQRPDVTPAPPNNLEDPTRASPYAVLGA
jgi:hypothetical protein